MKRWFSLVLLCWGILGILCLLLSPSQPVGLNPGKAAGWETWLDHGREPASSHPTASVARSIELHPAHPGSLKSLVSDSTSTANNTGPPRLATHGPLSIRALGNCRSSWWFKNPPKQSFAAKL